MDPQGHSPDRCAAWCDVWAQVHRLWGFAKDGISYDKTEWNILHGRLQMIEHGECRCDVCRLNGKAPE